MKIRNVSLISITFNKSQIKSIEVLIKSNFKIEVNSV
jgi:hypothetical protein